MPDVQSPRPTLLTRAEAAEYLRLSLAYIDILRMRGEGPKFIRFASRAVRYRVSDLDSWVASCASAEGGAR